LRGEDAVLKCLPPAFGAGIGAVADVDNYLLQGCHVTGELEVIEHVTAEPIHLISEKAVNLPDLVGGQPRPKARALPDRDGARHVHVYVYEDHAVSVVFGIVCDPGSLARGVRG
jgi:hypothetical protein